MNASEWNAKHPVGTPVIYFSVQGELDNGFETKTRSEAWELGSGAAVVSISGRTGGVHLTHLYVPKHVSAAEGETKEP